MKEVTMTLLASSYDQSKFFRAEDLTEETTLRMKSVTEEMVGQGADQEKKLVVWFTNSKKGLALNRTNNRTIRGAYGDDTAGWIGKLIVVFPTKADFRGRLVGALRVRIPPKKNPSITTASPTAKPAPAGKPEPEQEQDEEQDPDLDDEISL
jgi:hypothetical protein